jgi:GNAT superfamily N-acetyltransferase
VTGDDLYRRGVKTAVASWEAYARGADGAAVRRGPGVAAAVFPDEPQRSVYNTAMVADVEARGYAVAERTRAMGMALTEIRVPAPQLDLAPPDWSAYLRYLEAAGVPSDLLSDVDPGEFHFLLARRDGEVVATGLAFDLDGDCGIYNVSTLERERRRGLGTALTARLAYDAAARGCRTATLQSTGMAEGVYAAVGFRDLGAILEYAP